jgi:hypothetical protein
LSPGFSFEQERTSAAGGARACAQGRIHIDALAERIQIGLNRFSTTATND